MKYILLTLLFLSSLQTPLRAQMMVSDPAILAQLVRQFDQDTEKLQHLRNQLATINNLYETAQRAIKYQGDPANIVGGIKDTLLGGALNASSAGSTFDRLLGTLDQASSISDQLQRLLGGQASCVESIKSQILAGESPATNVAKYQAIETLFDQQQGALRTAYRQSTMLRSELASLREQVKNAPDQATTEKLLAAIASTSAALASTDATISQLQQQTQLSVQMVHNRKLLEEAAYQAAYKELSDQQAHAQAARMKEAFNNLDKTR